MLNNQLHAVVTLIIQQLAKSWKHTKPVFSLAGLEPASDYFVLFGLDKNNFISFK